AVAEAYHFYCAAAPLRRAELEARLLGDQSDGEIAQRMGLSPVGVAVYGALCCDVRPYLRCDGYIINVVLGGKPYKGIARDDHEAIRRSLGYERGGERVDEVLDCPRDPPVVPGRLDGLGPAELDELRGKLLIKAAIVTQTLPVDAM